MRIEALLFMVFSETIIVCLAGYFFYKVLTAKPKPEPDSYTNE